MKSRPWPIVLLAILQFLSPLIYILVAAFFYETSVASTTREMIALAPDLRKFEIFVLPLILGGLLFITRRTGYYFFLLGCIYQISRAVVVFMASNETDPVFPLVITNLIGAIAILYLLRPRTRMIYFNARMRWWETEPRYVVDFPASVSRVGASPVKSRIQNIASGGVGTEVENLNFLSGEKVAVEFQHEGIVYALKARVAWNRPTGNQTFLGLEWSADNSNAERSKVRRLVRHLQSKGVKTTHETPAWWDDFKSWVKREPR
ncbi:MAG: PilZ domain-containing protein [Cryobacterium sp.]|nr:PilZ domain-containing protein [Oligoflexia bacterium]